VLLSIRDYVRLAAPEPEVLRIIGEESKRKGTDKITSREIDQKIRGRAPSGASVDDMIALRLVIDTKDRCFSGPETGRPAAHRSLARHHLKPHH
jgi:hypothetical protein